MTFLSESSADPLGGPTSYLHQLIKGSEPISNPSPGAGGARRIQHYGEITVIPTYRSLSNYNKELFQNDLS